LTLTSRNQRKYSPSLVPLYKRILLGRSVFALIGISLLSVAELITILLAGVIIRGPLLKVVGSASAPLAGVEVVGLRSP